MCIAPAASCEKGARFATAPSVGTADGGGPVTWLSAARDCSVACACSALVRPAGVAPSIGFGTAASWGGAAGSGGPPAAPGRPVSMPAQ